jgi:hypothetical protein
MAWAITPGDSRGHLWMGKHRGIARVAANFLVYDLSASTCAPRVRLHPTLQHRHAEPPTAQRDAKLPLPKSCECMGQGERQKCRGQEEGAGGRPPLHKLECGDPYPMSHRLEHGITNRTFVPRSFVASAIDEKGRRDLDAACFRIPFVFGHSLLRLRRGFRQVNADGGGSPFEIGFGERV